MINSEEIARIVKDRNLKVIGLQFPEGLRRRAISLAKEIEEKAGVEVIISGDPCFGACDLAQMPVDLILHLGHAPMPTLDQEKVEFVELQMSLDSLDFLKKAFPYLRKRVGLISTVQYVKSLPQVGEFLKVQGFETLIGKGEKRLAYAGQILGCNFSAAKSIAHNVDCFLYVGTGNFHPLGVALATDKEVVIADPVSKEIRFVKELRNKILRQRHGAIARAYKAEVIGIIVSKKAGQNRMKLARKLKNRIEANGRRGLILLVDYVSADFLEGFQVDAFVSTACPRIAIDDYLTFKVPILTPPELEILLGDKTWEEYEFDEIAG